MSTIRATYVQHGSSAVPNITLNASGQVIVASGIVSSGTFAAPTGSAAAPGVYFVGDTNTGLYSPGANQVAVATNGVGRLFVDASGHVGINTSAPTNSFTSTIFKSTSGSAPVHIYNDTAYWGLFDNGGTTGGYAPGNGFAGHATNNFLNLFTAGSERLRITSAGLVGVGTSAPVQPLEVVTATGGGIALRPNAGNATQGLLWYDTGGGPYGFVKYDHQLSALSFGTVNTERARIDSSGRLLVGTSSSLESNSLIQSYKPSGSVYFLTRSDSLANGESAELKAVSGGRTASFGIYKHAGITNPGSYMYLQKEDGGPSYIWVGNDNNVRTSTTDTNIGTNNGTVVGSQTSDERVKNILGPVEYGLDTIKQIEPVRYAMKSEPDAEKLGFIAQQVQPLIPQSIFDTKEHVEGEPEDAPTKLGMEYVALIPVLVNAIKELSAEVDALKAQLS
jgi:hypothetical protein